MICRRKLPAQKIQLSRHGDECVGGARNGNCFTTANRRRRETLQKSTAPPGRTRLEQIHFATYAPKLKLDVRGERAGRGESCDSLFHPGARRGTRRGARPMGSSVSSCWRRPGAISWPRAEINLRAVDAATRWAATTNLALTLQSFFSHPTEHESGLRRSRSGGGTRPKGRSNSAEKNPFHGALVSFVDQCDSTFGRRANCR